MKKTFIYTVLGLFSIVSTVTAQERTPNGRIEAHDVVTTWSEGKITVSMRLDATRAALHRTEAIVLTPVIRTADKEQALAPVVVSGRNRMKSDRRAARFHRALPYNQASAVAPAVIQYNDATSYEPWMEGATLALKEDVYSCALEHTSGGSIYLTALRPAEPVKPEVQPAVTYVVPAAETVKTRHLSGTAFLDFPVGKSVIMTDFRNNFNELDKIRTLIDELNDDRDVIMDSIVLRGYSSPEGSYAVNKRLSQQRSEAMRDYLQKEYGYPASMFSVSSVPEDWDGLKTVVEESDMHGRDAVLAVIGSDAGPDVKEQRLKALAGYQELLRNYFPQLRRVEYRLYYTVRAFSVEDGREKILTDPGRMSLNEMFLVANTYPKGSDECEQAFDTAVRMFPADAAANINKAAVLLERGDAAAARGFLESYASYPAAWNNLGVMYMLEGDYAQARVFFGKAAAGTPEAVPNLDLLSDLEEYAKAKAGRDANPE